MFVHERKAIAVSTPQPHKTGKGIARIDFGGAAISPPHAASFKMTSRSGVWPMVLLLVAVGGRFAVASQNKQTQQALSEGKPADLDVDYDGFVLVRRCSDLAEDGAISVQALAKLCGFNVVDNPVEKPKELDADKITDRIIWKSTTSYEDGSLDDDVPAHDEVCKISDKKLSVWLFITANGKVIRFTDNAGQYTQLVTNKETINCPDAVKMPSKKPSLKPDTKFVKKTVTEDANETATKSTSISADDASSPALASTIASTARGGAMRMTVDGTLHDGPIVGARIFIDANRNNQADAGDILIDGETDSEGNYYGVIPSEYQDRPLVSNNKNAIHIFNGREILNDPNVPIYLVAPAGSKVISPLTHVIHVIADFSLYDVRNEKLFTGYNPLTDNIYTTGANFKYADYIKPFLNDLSLLITRYSHDYNVLGDKLRALLAEYAKSLDKGDSPPSPGEVIQIIDKEKFKEVVPKENTPETPGPVNLTPEAPQMTVTEDPAYRLMETAISTAQATGFRVSAIDPDPNETVTFSVHGDTRFEVRDGRLWVKAGQRFDYESEPSVTLTITATDNSAERLSDEQQITVQIANDLTESPAAEAEVPIETVPTIAGRKLDPLTITTKWRGADGNIGFERIGNWKVQNQDGGNELTLKIRFDDGDEIVVARLVRDDAQSAYRLDTSAGAPALNTKFAGKFGYFQITRVASNDATVGDSVAYLKWKYVLFGETGTGAPVNRLRPGESATESIGLITQSDAHETNRDEKTFIFTFKGKNDRPIFLESDSKAQTSADEFPVTVPADGVFPNWPWWQEDNIIQLVARPVGKDITVDRSDGLVWRFVPVDVDGDYFKTSEDGAPRDYGDIADFVARYIGFETGLSGSRSQAHQYFEVVQAVDSDGNPHFITMPGEESNGNADRLPVLDLRLKSNLPDETIPTQYLSLVLRGGGENFPNNEVVHKFAISLREVYGRDGQQDVFRIISNGMPEENAPIFVNFEDGRDLIDMGSRDTVWWKLSDDGKSTILYSTADGSNEKVLAIMRGFVANHYNLNENDFRFDYPVFGITVNPILHVSSSAGSQGTIGQRDYDAISGYTMLPDDNLASASLDFI